MNNEPTNELGNYLTMEYGPLQRLMCNVHFSSGTHMAQKPHYHDFYQIYFIVNGSLIHHTANCATEVMRGDCFIVPPYFRHYIELGKELPIFYSFSFYQEFLPTYVRENAEILHLLSVLTPKTLMARIRLPAKLLYRMEELMTFSLREFEEKQPGWDCSLQGMLAAILVLFSRVYFYEKEMPPVYSPALLASLEYVNAHFTEPLCVEDLADQAFLSLTTFYHFFKEMTGRSFKQYVSFLRIRHAGLLLSQTDKSIASISIECGYNDYSAFYRAFEKQLHLSPVDYRKSFRKPFNSL